MIEKLYGILVVQEDGEETIFAIAGDPMQDLHEPLQMQCVSGNKKKMEAILSFAKETFPEKKYRLTEFVRAN